MRTLGFALLLLAAAPAGAVPPVQGVTYPAEGPCRLNRQAAAERLRVLRTARSMGVLPPRSGLAAPRVLVIRVQFPGIPMGASLAATQTLFSQVRDYFAETSYGLMVPTFTVTSNVYTLPQALPYYGADTAPFCAEVDCNTEKLFDDAAAAALGDVVFLNHDHVMIYHAGDGQESCGLSAPCQNLIWSLYMDVSKTAGGKTFPGFTAVPESDGGSLSVHGVISHEYAHQQGLPDLYDVISGKTTMGRWDLMDYPYGASPDQTPHLGAWSKHFMGYSAPSASTGAVTLAPAETTRGAAVRLAHPAVNESFFMEYRLQASTAVYDKGAAAPAGMALWRVDEALALDGGAVLLNNHVNAPSANGTGHRGVDIIEADGIQAGTGDLGNNDLFTNGSAASGDATSSFSGQPSGMTAAVVGGAGSGALSVNVIYFTATPAVGITRLINYPNPGGDVSRYPVRAGAPAGTVTTLVAQLTKPLASAGDFRCALYDLDGNLVRTLPGDVFTLKAGPGDPTTDGKWVYEHDWDGRNDDGAEAASGVYLLRVKAKGQVKTGKVVVLR